MSSSAAGRRNPDDSFSFEHGDGVGRAEVRAQTAPDAQVGLSLSLFIVVDVSGTRIAFLDACAASDAQVCIDDGQIIG